MEVGGRVEQQLLLATNQYVVEGLEENGKYFGWYALIFNISAQPIHNTTAESTSWNESTIGLQEAKEFAVVIKSYSEMCEEEIILIYSMRAPGISLEIKYVGI